MHIGAADFNIIVHMRYAAADQVFAEVNQRAYTHYGNFAKFHMETAGDKGKIAVMVGNAQAFADLSNQRQAVLFMIVVRGKNLSRSNGFADIVQQKGKTDHGVGICGLFQSHHGVLAAVAFGVIIGAFGRLPELFDLGQNRFEGTALTGDADKLRKIREAERFFQFFPDSFGGEVIKHAAGRHFVTSSMVSGAGA